MKASNGKGAKVLEPQLRDSVDRQGDLDGGEPLISPLLWRGLRELTQVEAQVKGGAISKESELVD